MTAHTPGPWLLGRGSRATGFTVVIGSGEHLVGGYGLASEANARLIAAAPDMLAALEGYMARVEYAVGPDWYEAMRTAIAKARGEA